MNKVSFAIIGLGNRGTAYIKTLRLFPDKAEINAIADNRQICLDSANGILGLPQNRLFDGADSILSQPKLADIMVIATQDAQHRDHAIRAMEIGYDLLLEKPIANRLEDIQQIVSTAERLNRKVIICHVLRYTPFYQTVKKLLNDGAVGRIIDVQAAEHVSCQHMAHAYVRGKWRRAEDSSPILLAKCCHDMDIILWLTGRNCVRLNSFGGLDYFNAENCPEGAPERCEDGCPVKNCPYHAVDFYIPRVPGWPSKNIIPNPTKESMMEILRSTQFGKCVFKQDNNVADHQTVNMQLDGGITVTFNMNAFHTVATRTIRICGTKGELWGDLHQNKICVQPHGQQLQEIDVSKLQTVSGGHSGGDYGLIRDVIRYFLGEEFDSSYITTLNRSAESHYVAFAAEESRLNNGITVDMDSFTA